MLSKFKTIVAAFGLTLLVLATQFDRLAKMAFVAYLEHQLSAIVEIRGALQLQPGTHSTVSANDILVAILSRSLLSQMPIITNLWVEQASLQVQAAIENESENDDEENAARAPLDLELSMQRLDQLFLSFEHAPTQIDSAKLYRSQLAYQDADQNINLTIAAAPLLALPGAKEVRDGPLSLTTHLHDEDHKLIWFSQASVGELVVDS